MMYSLLFKLKLVKRSLNIFQNHQTDGLGAYIQLQIYKFTRIGFDFNP